MIKNTRMTQIAKSIVLSSTFAGMLLSVGCVTKTVSHNISSSGQVQASDIVFPDLDDAWEKDGLFPNRENLNKVRAGVSKDQLYQMIGRPHFSESQHAREWDYILKFYQADDSVKVCQYKIIFDKDYHAQEFYWKPADCAQYAKIEAPVPVTIPTPIIIHQTQQVEPQPVHQPIMSERINLSADALFAFNKWQTQDMTHQGQQSLDQLAAKLREYQKQGDSRIIITGYTDRLGDAMYNLNLSQLRAQTVREYLIMRGVEPASMVASGAGESNPVKSCSDSLGRQALIDCLQPNRRVQVDVNVYEHSR
ncbi:OmpA family protein [Psychrobacter sp. I-STPA10]|uniref:OmpA family protein n=1 Tax=Psychrobacter sp. I-STPA10 TaxID=2585769 RepID=UPI001E556D28|nr:OmpA family protein [Psychrobacter sp. I-STPA10]